MYSVSIIVDTEESGSAELRVWCWKNLRVTHRNKTYAEKALVKHPRRRRGRKNGGKGYLGHVEVETMRNV